MSEEIAERFNMCQTLLKVLQENMNHLGYLIRQKESEEVEPDEQSNDD